MKKQESSGSLARAGQLPRIPAVGATCSLRRPFCAELNCGTWQRSLRDTVGYQRADGYRPGWHGSLQLFTFGLVNLTMNS